MRDLNHPYLKTQLIAYIGNKRTLQRPLAEIFLRISGESRSETRIFLDPFAGSGAVSRLARFLGFRVLANDWELYSYILNFAHLCVGWSESSRLFREKGGLSRVIEELNRLGDPPEGERYIARYYAPANTDAADYRVERLFYTRENALRIDAVRGRIEDLYPGDNLEGDRKKEKFLLLAALLYQSATHTNTSGVFKACHKGFGGHGRDALRRIMAPVQLQVPELIDGPPAEAGCCDAAEFARRRPADLCYLDPPYNQHQYGSNYHLLNTIARWDRLPVSDRLGPDGRLLHKAGIRSDWIETRSPYCYRHSAPQAFRDLLEAVDARWIVVSYNDGGIVPLEALVEMLASQGRLTVHTNDYVVYRGGKQSIVRQVHNQELILVLQRGGSSPAVRLNEVRRLVALNRLRLLLKRSFDPPRIAASFRARDGGIEVLLGGRSRVLPMTRLYRFLPEAVRAVEAPEHAATATEQELAALADALESCAFADLREEVEGLISLLLETGVRPPLSQQERGDFQRRILRLLRKYAHRKYRDSFAATVRRLWELLGEGRDDPQEWQVLSRELPAIESLARARFEG